MSKKTEDQVIPTRRTFKVNSLEEELQKEEKNKLQRDLQDLQAPFKTDDNILSMKYFVDPLIPPPKFSVSSPEVEGEGNAQQSADDELTHFQRQLLNELVMAAPIKTFDSLGIRRSHSYDKDKLQLSLSSDYVDRQYEREAMRRKIEKLTHDIEQLAEVQISTKSELLIYKKKNQKSEQNNQKLQKQVNRLRTELNQCKQILKQKQQRIIELEEMVERMTVSGNEKAGKECERYENMMKLMSIEFQNRLQGIHLSHRTQINALKTEFQSARIIGQNQINKLTEDLQQKCQELIQLHKKLKQLEFDKKSTIVSQNLSVSKVNGKNSLRLQQQKKIGYLDRFYHFSQIIDRKLCNSTEKQRLFEGMTTQSNVSIRQPQSPNYFTGKKNVQLQLNNILNPFKSKLLSTN